MDYKIESGIPYAHIMAYIKEELALPQDGAGFFCYRDCQIRVWQLSPRKLGRMEVPRTELAFTGGEAAREEFMEKFLMRFLSAGG